MKDVVIRKFKHTDVDAFIHLAQTSFAEESFASGITPEDFERETRKIFRWKMIPYRLLTALMGVKWEAFVAEKDGQVVGGGMYIGRNNHMTITNLMVDPQYRRQGIGQTLLIKRLERLSERGFPYVTAQVLETNIASLENLKKQDFEVFNQYSIYERNLPFPEGQDAAIPPITIREMTGSDRALCLEIEKKTTQPSVLKIKGSAESQYLQTSWRKLYNRYTGYSGWTKAVVAQGESIGFFNVISQQSQGKGYLMPPLISDEQLQYLPQIFSYIGAWLAGSGKGAMIIEVPGHRALIHDHLIDTGWKKIYTWYELIKWLDEKARHKFEEQ